MLSKVSGAMKGGTQKRPINKKQHFTHNENINLYNTKAIAIEKVCIKTMINSYAVLRHARINMLPTTSSPDAVLCDAMLQFYVMPWRKKLCIWFEEECINRRRSAIGKGCIITSANPDAVLRHVQDKYVA